jgi:glycosyltransferase involved in cell wall biosynthesis
MRIGMLLHDPQEFGGLEEYAATLAVGLRQLGHEVSVVSDTWVPGSNQYVRRLRDHEVPFVQPPRWVSRPVSHWETKERLIEALTHGLAPVAWVGAPLAMARRRCAWPEARLSARHALRGWLTRHVVGPDRRNQVARVLLDAWAWRWRPDVLHIQGYTRNLLYAVEWAQGRIPVVYEEHQTPDARFNWWERFHETVNKAQRVVAVSEESARALRAVCGVTRPIAVRSPLLPDPADGTRVTTVDPSRARPLRVTTVARLVVAKGLDYLLPAIARVRAVHPGVEFRVHGDGPLREDLLAQAASLGLDGHGIFVGAFTDRAALTDILRDTDIFVMSSVLEGQPLGLVEAMAHGCPIVTTDVGGIPELIEDGVNGLLCGSRDADAIALRIETLLAQPELRRRLGAAARRTYERGPYQPSAVCAHLASIYADAHREALATPA